MRQQSVFLTILLAIVLVGIGVVMVLAKNYWIGIGAIFFGLFTAFMARDQWASKKQQKK